MQQKQLIENLVACVNKVCEVVTQWNRYVGAEWEDPLERLIRKETFQELNARKSLRNTFREAGDQGYWY